MIACYSGLFRCDARLDNAITLARNSLIKRVVDTYSLFIQQRAFPSARASSRLREFFDVLFGVFLRVKDSFEVVHPRRGMGVIIRCSRIRQQQKIQKVKKVSMPALAKHFCHIFFSCAAEDKPFRCLSSH
jgi:hypothetical protein